MNKSLVAFHRDSNRLDAEISAFIQNTTETYLLFHVKDIAELKRNRYPHMPDMKKEHITMKVCSF